MSKTRIQRFWAKIEERPGPLFTACWIWTGATAQGYGRFWDGEKLVQAHRYAYELFVGCIPEGLEPDHLCRDHACVRPDHLEPVTRRENLLRGETVIAAQVQREYCPKGHSYDEANTRINTDGRRDCRACDRLRYRERVGLLGEGQRRGEEWPQDV